jgi:hypothetical protein
MILKFILKLYVNRHLFEQIKNGPNIDHGICFTSPTALVTSDPKLKGKNIDDSSRYIAARLSSRQGNDIVLMPYNPGFDFPPAFNKKMKTKRINY